MVIGSRRCLFMDVPGFNTRDFDDWDVFQRLMTGMSIVHPYVQFRGVLYVDSMENNRGKITEGQLQQRKSSTGCFVSAAETICLT